MVSEKALIATECPGVDRQECCVSKKKGPKNIEIAFFFFFSEADVHSFIEVCPDQNVI